MLTFLNLYAHGKIWWGRISSWIFFHLSIALSVLGLQRLIATGKWKLSTTFMNPNNYCLLGSFQDESGPKWLIVYVGCYDTILMSLSLLLFYLLSEHPRIYLPRTYFTQITFLFSFLKGLKSRFSFSYLVQLSISNLIISWAKYWDSNSVGLRSLN